MESPSAGEPIGTYTVAGLVALLAGAGVGALGYRLLFVTGDGSTASSFFGWLTLIIGSLITLGGLYGASIGVIGKGVEMGIRAARGDKS